MSALATVPRGTPHTLMEGIGLDLIDVGPNVRADVGDLAELTASIAEYGLLQPVGVTAGDGDRWQLVYGHRRLAAARAAGLERIPAMVLYGDVDAIVLQLLENLQRRDLPPLDEALALRALLDADPSLTHEDLAAKIARSRPWVSNTLRILDLDPKVMMLVGDGKLTASHAKALGSLKGKAQRDYAETAVQRGMSAHDLEESVEQYHERQKRDADEVAELATWAEKAEEVLLEKGADKKQTVLTSTDGYGYNRDDPPLKAMKARGWKVGSPTASYSRGKCECDAFGVSRTWEGKVLAVRRCIVQAHYAAKNQASGRNQQESWEEQNRERKIHDAVVERVRRGARPRMVAAFKKLPPDVARIVLWVAFDWGLHDWVRDHKGDRKKPDAWGALADLQGDALAEELATFVLKGLTDRYNVKLDWPAIAAAFGVKLEEPPAKKAKA